MYWIFAPMAFFRLYRVQSHFHFWNSKVIGLTLFVGFTSSILIFANYVWYIAIYIDTENLFFYPWKIQMVKHHEGFIVFFWISWALTFLSNVAVLLLGLSIRPENFESYNTIVSPTIVYTTSSFVTPSTTLVVQPNSVPTYQQPPQSYQQPQPYHYPSSQQPPSFAGAAPVYAYTAPPGYYDDP